MWEHVWSWSPTSIGKENWWLLIYIEWTHHLQDTQSPISIIHLHPYPTQSLTFIRLCFCQPKQPHRGPVFPRSPRVFFKLCLVAKIKISQIISFLFICSWTREKCNQKEGNSRQKLLGSFAYTHLLTKEQAGPILSFQGSNTYFSSEALYIIH